MFGANKREKGFKDYCLILQVHPEADGAMVDAAYWHLAKRYNQAASYDPNAREKLEELNEAYIVLGSPQRRDEYMKVRARVLGEGALPLAPSPTASKPPLTVMARQRPAERVEQSIAPPQVSFPVGRLLAATAVVAIAVAVLAIAVSPMLGLLAGLVFGAMLAGAALVLILPSAAGKLFRRPKHETPAARQLGAHDARSEHREMPSTERQLPRVSSAAADKDLENAESRTLAVVQPPRAPEAEYKTPALVSDESTEQPQGLTRDQIEQIKRQTAAYRRAADQTAPDDSQQTPTELGPQLQPEHSTATPEGPPDEPQGLTRDQIELIKKQAAAYRRAADAKASDDRLQGASENALQQQFDQQATPLAMPETPPPEPAEQPQGLSRDQIDQIRKQTAAYRRAAQAGAVRDSGPPIREPSELDPAEAEKVRAQTERLKAIADKFNAAKAKGATQPPDQAEPL